MQVYIKHYIAFRQHLHLVWVKFDKLFNIFTRTDILFELDINVCTEQSMLCACKRYNIPNHTFAPNLTISNKIIFEKCRRPKDYKLAHP